MIYSVPFEAFRFVATKKLYWTFGRKESFTVRDCLTQSVAEPSENSQTFSTIRDSSRVTGFRKLFVFPEIDGIIHLLLWHVEIAVRGRASELFQSLDKLRTKVSPNKMNTAATPK